MNKLIIALSVACASACVFADNATPTSFDKLQFDADVDWFEAKAGESAPALTGLTNTGKQLTVENGMLVVETDADAMEAVTLQATTERSKDITTVTFNMLASTVPAENLKDMTDKGKIAFAISGEDSARGFKAWLGADKGWVTLSTEDVPLDDGEYRLVVRFDSRENVNKVCFEVDGAKLGDGWYSYAGAPVAKAVSIDLVGSGKITSIIGVENPIKAEVIYIGDLGNVVIPEEIAKKYEATATAPGKSGVNVATAVALGIMKVDGGQIVVKENVDFTVKADATAMYSNAIPVKFPNFNPENVPNTTDISYQLMGSADGSEYSVVKIGGEETVDNVADVKIPASEIEGGKRYFKVVTKVSVRDPNPSQAQ